MMNQQSQNFVQGNAGGNVNAPLINQYLQQRSQQHQNQAIARHLRTQSNFNGNQQNFSQQQTGQLMNGNNNNVIQGATPAQLNQLRAMQQQLQANIAMQRQMQQKQQQQQQQQRLSIQSSLNMNQQQQQQTQQANNADGAGVIKDLFSQLQSINQKLEHLSSNEQKQSAANQQPRRSSPLTTANNNGISNNNAQASMPTNQIGQSSQRPNPMMLQPHRPSPPTTTNNNGIISNNAQVSVAANRMGQSFQRPVPANAMVQPSNRAKPVNTTYRPSHHPMQISTMIQPSQLPVPGNTQGQQQQSLQQTLSAPTHANLATSRLSAQEIIQRQSHRQTGTIANGQSLTTEKRKQPPATAANTGVARAASHASRPSNPRPIAPARAAGQPQGGQMTTIAPTKPTAASTNRQDANTITRINIISYSMKQIVKELPAELEAAYLKLHGIQRYVMEKTVVFKFEKTARRDSDTSDEENTPQAGFFLKKLQSSSTLAEKKFNLVGMKCLLCNSTSGYVDGSTSFMDVENSKTLGLLPHVLEARRNHMLQCPDCMPKSKEILAAYVPTIENIQDLLSFSQKWLLVLRASYFNGVPNYYKALVVPPPRPPPQQQQQQQQPKERTDVAEFLPITEDSIYEELVSAVEMGKAMGDLRLDDLTDTLDKLLSPAMEVLLSSFRLQSNAQTGIELCWKHTSAENDKTLLVWSFDKPFNVDDDFCNRIWHFFKTHCNACSELSSGIRKLVSSTQLPVEEMKFVGKNWSEYASRVAQNKKATKPKADVKILFPAYIATPLKYLPGQKSGTFPLKGSFNDNDVVMIGAYREFVGNRRFRQTVSQFRGLYQSLPSNKQSFVVEQLITLIQRRGGSFYSKTGYLAQSKESFAFTQNALQNGFPEMMHPVFTAEAKSVVWDLEFTRMVDILPDRKESKNRAKKMMIESLSMPRAASAESNENSNSRRPPPSRRGQPPANPTAGATVYLQEGHPVDISNLKNRYVLDRRKTTKEPGTKRKQAQSSVNKEGSKRPRKSI